MDKMERIDVIGDGGYQDYDETANIVQLDGYYTAEQLRQIAAVMDEPPC